MAMPIVNAYVDGRELVLVSRDANSRVVVQRKAAEYVSYLKTADVPIELGRELRGSRYVTGMKAEGPWCRVTWADEGSRREMLRNELSPLVKADIESFEGDVDPVVRYCTDHDVEIAKPQRCYLDIETDSRVPFAEKEKMRILTWAVSAHDTGERWSGVLREWTDAAERALLQELWAALQRFDQICAWYGDGFDFPVICARSGLLGISVDARRFLFVDHLEVVKKLNAHAAESGDEKRSMKLEDIGQSITGRGKLKPPPEVSERWPDKSLGSITYEMWEAGGQFRQWLLDYNVQDTDLLREIELKTGYLELFETVCQVCRIVPNTAGLQGTHYVDGYMLRLGKERGHHFATRKFSESVVKFKGAYVMQPASLDADWRAKHGMQDGIARNVHVCDFAGMYPSIIISFNMSPDTKLPNAPINGPIPGGTCRAPITGVSFATDREGILPTALRDIIARRKRWNDLKASLPPGTPDWHSADRMSGAYKIVANTFYGVVGSPFSRYFDKSVAESVTQVGVWLLKATMHEAERRGFAVLYGDTDSAFVTNASRDAFGEFVRWCTAELYPRMLGEQGAVVNEIKLAYEKEFDRLAMTSAKRYCGSFRHYKWSTTCVCTTAKGNPGSLNVRTLTCADCGMVHGSLPPIRSAPEIKGLEYKRGDVLRMAAELQACVIDMLVGGLGVAGDDCLVPTATLEHYHAKLSRVRQRILEQPLALEDVKLSKGLSRGLKDYSAKKKLDGADAAQPPHVQVAHILKKRGQDVREGTRIEYFVLDGNSAPMLVAPAADWTGECDRYYIWEDLVYPATQRLLEAAFPGHDWEVWRKVRPAKIRVSKAATAAAALAEQSALFGNVELPAALGQRKRKRAEEGAENAKAK
jgi:DNA polymerase elongation subunit (family B)